MLFRETILIPSWRVCLRRVYIVPAAVVVAVIILAEIAAHLVTRTVVCRLRTTTATDQANSRLYLGKIHHLLPRHRTLIVDW